MGDTSPGLARRLGVFDATMLVMGGIVGAGIFINPHVVAMRVREPALILGAWLLGGVVALLGAFVYAELAARRPDVGGQYAYLREAYHPLLAFLYGWGLLLVVQTGGMAAVAITFARYFLELSGFGWAEGLLATLALALLTAVNCLGVGTGSTVQSVLMLLKIFAILALVAFGLSAHPAPSSPAPAHLTSASVVPFLSAMGPVLFAYGGWQTASFVAGELCHPERDLPRGLVLGVAGVIALYVGVSFVCLRVLGPVGLAGSERPASEVMNRALGHKGAVVIAVGIAVSTLGFLSQGILTAPRVYYAMARDGVFFKEVAWVSPVTRVPVVAICLQGVVAIVIALSGRYEQILNYVVSVDFLFCGLTGASLLVFRHRDGPNPPGYAMPGHPVTTVLFVAACWAVAFNTFYRYPANTAIGALILLSGVPAFYLWRRKS